MPPKRSVVASPRRSRTPVVGRDRRPRRSSTQSGAEAASKRRDKPERILVVEDDFLVARQIEAALSEAGIMVGGIASTTDEAIALATALDPRLVLMDVRLADERDGIDAALDLFERHRIRCLFATAHCDENTRRRAEPAAPLGWVQKPYSMDLLIATVRKALIALKG